MLIVRTVNIIYTVKPVYKGHSREPENVPIYEQLPFIYRFMLYALFINGKITDLIFVRFKAEFRFFIPDFTVTIPFL